MNAQVTRCIKSVGLTLQPRLFTIRTVPCAISFLPRSGVLRFSRFEPSRKLSSTRNFFKEARGTRDGWMDQGVPDVYKWNEQMDELAERSKTDLRVIEEWACLLNEGVAAKLPNIEDTLIRHAELSLNLAIYMEKVRSDYEEDEMDEMDEEEMDGMDEEEMDEMDEEEMDGMDEEEIEGLTAEEKTPWTKEKEEESKLEDVADEELANEGAGDCRAQRGGSQVLIYLGAM